MKIKKENHILDVSPDAYKSMYKRLGYQPVKTLAISNEENEEIENKNTKSKNNNTDNK